MHICTSESCRGRGGIKSKYIVVVIVIVVKSLIAGYEPICSVVYCGGCSRQKLSSCAYCSSVGHSLRGIHRPSSSKRGLRGYASPSSLFDPIGTGNSSGQREAELGSRLKKRDIRSHVHVRGPKTCSQCARTSPSHHKLPSRPIRPHSAFHAFRVRRFSLRRR